jgi:hypothetical protein
MLGRQWLQDNETYPIVQAICLLLLSNGAESAAKYIRGFMQRFHYSHLMRDLIIALGHSDHNAATDLLVEIAQNTSMAGAYAAEIINALACKRTRPIKDAFLDVLSAEPTQTIIPSTTRVHGQDVLPGAFSRLMAADAAFKDEVLRRCTPFSPPAHRELVARALESLGTPEAFEAAVPAIAGGGNWVGLFLTDLLTRHAPASGGLATILPASDRNPRSHLLRMMIREPQLRDKIFEVLGVIEQIRVDYGKPAEEPRHPDIDTGVPWPQIGWAQ